MNVVDIEYPKNAWWFVALCIALSSYQMWQILFVDKVFRRFQDFVHRRFPPEGFEYAKLTDVPKRKVKTVGLVGTVTVTRERYPVMFLGDRGRIHAVTLPFDDSLPEPAPIISRDGAWVVVAEGGSVIGDSTVCSDCAPFWFVVALNVVAFVLFAPFVYWFAFLVAFPRSIMNLFHKIRTL
jgi:hypothetical protein